MKSRNFFNGLPCEVTIDKKAKYVVVADLFVNDYVGGAELTTEAIIEACPEKNLVARLHSASVTPELVASNKDKNWIITNFAMLSFESIMALMENQVKYSIVEYDYKVCRHRSVLKHFKEEGIPCDCAEKQHGQYILLLFYNATSLHWMAEKQMNYHHSLLEELKEKPNYVQSSTFNEATLDMLKNMRTTTNSRANKWCFQGEGSWIKGINETEEYLTSRQLPFVKIGKLPYEEFLKEMNRYSGFIFQPLDSDTCPRIVIEAKLLGMELILNDNVSHKDELWFSGTVEDTENYLRNNGREFWKRIKEAHSSEI